MKTIKVKSLTIVLIAVVFLFLASPVWAAYTFVQLPNGDYEVTFIYNNPDAERVCLSSAFNNYSPNATQLTQNADGVWEITIIMKQGVYQYKYVVDGEWTADPDVEEKIPPMMNSVIRLTSDKMKGEFEIGGEVVNQIIREGEDKPVAFENNLMVDVSGKVKKERNEQEVDVIAYRTKLKVEGKVNDIKEPGTYAEVLSPDKIYIDNLDVTYFGDIFALSVQGNKEDKTNSFDYLGLIDAVTAKDNRDYTKNPNDFGESRRIKLASEKNSYSFNAALNEYGSEIGDQKSNRKYFGYLNLKKKLANSTGKVNGEIGLSSLLYQPVVADDLKELSTAVAVFGEYEIAKNLTVRGEYAFIPIGSINETLSGAEKAADGKWKFIFDPRDYDELDEDDIKKIKSVRIAGDFNEWNVNDPQYTLTKDEDEDIWYGAFDIGNVDDFKYKEFSWTIDGDWFPGNFVCLPFGRVPDTPLNYGRMYMAEANYRILDATRSFKERKKLYKFDYTVGVMSIDEKAYLPVARDVLRDDRNGDRVFANPKDKPDYFEGIKKIYGKGYYYPGVEGLKLTLDTAYQPHYKEKDVIISRMLKPGFVWNKPIEKLSYLKGHVEYNQSKNFYWKKINHDADHPDRITELYLGMQTRPVGFLKKIKADTTYRQDLNIALIAGETELDPKWEQVAYIKGGIDYIIGSYGADQVEEPRFWTETRLQNLPGIKKYFPYLVVGYTYDESNLNEKKEYFDPNDNDDSEDDWTQHVYGELGFKIPAWENFEASVKLETMKVEKDLHVLPDDIEEDSKYYRAYNYGFIDWYTLLHLTTSYDLPYGIRGDLGVIYDLNHNKVSPFEDYALKIGLAKAFTKYSTLKAEYNKKEGDVIGIYQLKLETLF